MHQSINLTNRDVKFQTEKGGGYLLEPTTRAGGGARERGQRRCEAAATAS